MQSDPSRRISWALVVALLLVKNVSCEGKGLGMQRERMIGISIWDILHLLHTEIGHALKVLSVLFSAF